MGAQVYQSESEGCIFAVAILQGNFCSYWRRTLTPPPPAPLLSQFHIADLKLCIFYWLLGHISGGCWPNNCYQFVIVQPDDNDKNLGPRSDPAQPTEWPALGKSKIIFFSSNKCSTIFPPHNKFVQPKTVVKNGAYSSSSTLKTTISSDSFLSDLPLPVSQVSLVQNRRRDVLPGEFLFPAFCSSLSFSFSFSQNFYLRSCHNCPHAIVLWKLNNSKNKYLSWRKKIVHISVNMKYSVELKSIFHILPWKRNYVK